MVTRLLETPWRSRGYLPHFDQPGLVQGITFRLADSLPQSVLEQLDEELRGLQEVPRKVERRERIAKYLDRGAGECHLQDPRVATRVANTLLHFDGIRYSLLGWCIMPNHVHAVLETKAGYGLDLVLHAWKSFSAKKANEILDRRGRFWQRDYYDRFIRDEDHLLRALRYVENNPVVAGLVERAEDWQWSSARRR